MSAERVVSALDAMREAAGISDEECEICGEPEGDESIRYAIDGAWAHKRCLDKEVPGLFE